MYPIRHDRPNPLRKTRQDVSTALDSGTVERGASRRDVIAAAGGLAVTMIIPGHASAQSQASERGLIFRTTDPNNAEPALQDLVKSWITPNEHFYIRSHAPNPKISPDRYRLSIEGMVRKPLTLTLDDLQRFDRKQVTATLTCAGNRRAEYNREGKVGGVQWEAGAIGNAKWSGINLADVLREAELLQGARHVWFDGLDQIPRGDEVIPFGGSIPIEKAMLDSEPGALLADQMNGAPLTPDHGYPLRTVVPGYIGARSVKWLGRIVVSDRPSPNHYVATAYKIVKSSDAIEWAESGPIYRYPINAAICTPEPNATLKTKSVTLAGYVLPTGRADARVNRVFVSANGGDSWTKAELTGQNNAYCWQLWKATVPVSRETRELIVRANDTSGGFMPARVPWNAKGYLQNSWYRLPVNPA